MQMIYIGKPSYISKKKTDEVWCIQKNEKLKIKHWDVVKAWVPSDYAIEVRKRAVDVYNLTLDMFRDKCAPIYIKQIISNENAKNLLTQLIWYDKIDTVIGITTMAYPEAEHLSYISVLAGILQGSGCRVQLGSGKDYSVYCTYPEVRNFLKEV